MDSNDSYRKTIAQVLTSVRAILKSDSSQLEKLEAELKQINLDESADPEQILQQLQSIIKAHQKE